MVSLIHTTNIPNSLNAQQQVHTKQLLNTVLHEPTLDYTAWNHKPNYNAQWIQNGEILYEALNYVSLQKIWDLLQKAGYD